MRRRLVAASLAIAVLGAGIGVYGWRAVSEYRGVERTWKSYLDGVVDANVLNPPSEVMSNLTRNADRARLAVEDATVLTFGARKIRSAMLSYFGAIAKRQEAAIGVPVQQLNQDAHFRYYDDLANAGHDRVDRLMRRFRRRWHLRT